MAPLTADAACLDTSFRVFSIDVSVLSVSKSSMLAPLSPGTPALSLYTVTST